MTRGPNDPMWAEFKPLWVELQQAKKLLLVAGGYGLYLKEFLSRTPPGLATIIPTEQWREATPRVTKDVDLIVSLDLIGNKEANQATVQALDRCGFKATPNNRMWQFEKNLSTGKMLIDLHARVPDEPHPNLTTDARTRVKHKPSLGDAGIHGRQNPEAVGSEIHPYPLEIEGVQIAVPNPLTWSVMKLTAMNDRRARSEEATRSEENRAFEREHAVKHAQDICRIVALTTREESDRVSEVLAAVSKTDEFGIAARIADEYFKDEDGWAARIVKTRWEAAGFQLIRDTLRVWFG